MQEIIRDCKGAIPILVILAILICSLLSAWLGYEIGGGQIFLIAIAAGVGLIFGLVVFPNFVRIIRWTKSVYREVKE